MNLDNLSRVFDSYNDFRHPLEIESFERALDTEIERLSAERATLSERDDQHAMERFRARFLPTVHQSEFCKYVYEKPRGYAGDYVTQEMIWLGRTGGSRHRFRGTSAVGEAINAATMDMHNCKANEERVFRLQSYIRECGRRIMSIGCGSAIEFWDYEPDATGSKEIVFVDQDAEALQRVRRKLAQCEGVDTSYHHHSVVKYIFSDHPEIEKRDLLYLFGLLDYFPLDKSQQIVRSLWKLVAPGGLLVVTNAHSRNPTRLWMEYVGDWFLKYKDEQQLATLTEDLDGVADSRIVTDTYGIYQYLEVRGF